MFGRRPSPDNDAVAVARRRLAALAAQFDVPGRESVSGATGGGLHPAAGPRPTSTEGFASGAGTRFDTDTNGSRLGGAGDPADSGFDDVEVEAESSGLSMSRANSGRGPAAAGGVVPSPGRHAARAAACEYGRWGFAPQHITVLALLLAAVLAVAAWVVLRSAPHAAPVQLTNERTVPSPTGSSFTGSTVSPAQTPASGTVVTPASAAQSASSLLVIDVTGKVKRPGIVELPAGSRVVDALKAAGGARPGVRTSLNLARPLVDGEQIVVGLKVPPVNLVPSPAVSGGATPGVIAPVDLNTATQEQLETLPGVGPVTAAAILQWRTQHGQFTSVDQLLDVSGIGDVTLANIKAYVHV